MGVRGSFAVPAVPCRGEMERERERDRAERGERKAAEVGVWMVG